jgi:hypothetical protein
MSRSGNFCTDDRRQQWQIQDLEKGGSSIAVRALCAHEFLDATTTFGKNHAHFDRFERNFQPYQSNRSVFERILKLKHAKVSHNSSFLSSVAREGGSI